MPSNSVPDPINGLSLLDRFSGFVRQLSSSSTSGTYLVTSPDTHKNRHQSEIIENGKKYLWESLFKSNVYNEHFQRPASILNVNIVPCLKYSELISTRDVEAIIIEAYLRGILPYTPSHGVLHGKSSKSMAKHNTPISILDFHVQASYSGPEDFKPNLTLNLSKHIYIPSIESFLNHVNTNLTLNKNMSAITPSLSNKREEPLNFEQNFEIAIETSVINSSPPPLPPPMNGHTYAKYDDYSEIKASNILEVSVNFGKMALGNSVSHDSIKFIDDPQHIIEECQNLQNINKLFPENCCELNSAVVDDSWRNEELDWSSPTDFAFGISTTLYERQPGTRTNNTFAGDPVADAFAIRAQGNGAILALADGVNWGRKARIAARSAIQGAMKYLGDILCCPHNGVLKPRSTLELFEHLLKAFYVAHCEIVRRSGGLTTLTLAIVCQMVPDGEDDVWLKKASEYGVCVCNVGDSNAYIFDSMTGNITEITAGSRDIHAMRNLRDAGGALGSFEGSQMPELNNLTLSQARGLRWGDVVYLTSDGVSDNMDPLVRKKALYPKQPQPTDPALHLSNGPDEIGVAKHADHITGDKSKGGWQNILAPRSSSVKPIQSDWFNKHITCPPQITAIQRHELTLIHMSCVVTDWMYCPKISKLDPNLNPGPRPALHSIGHAARDEDILRCEPSKSLLNWRPALRRAQSTPHSKATPPQYNLNTCTTQKTTISTPSPDDVFGPQGPEDIYSNSNTRLAFPITARELCGRLLNYCLQATEGKRRILEHPSLYDNGHANKAEDFSDSESEFEVLKVQKDRRKRVRHKLSLAAGKLDHATVVAYQINAGAGEKFSPSLTTEDRDSNRSNLDSSKSKNSCRKANTRQTIETQL